MDYKEAGVDVEKGDLFVEKIKKFVGDTYTKEVVSGVGGFAALYEIDEDRYLASGTDGVGTKVKLAQELGLHKTIGQDLVAMCVNDVICTGARPMFFLDYFATGRLDLSVSCDVVEGIASACREVKCALIGGETAEMPGVYADGVYDLAGFCVGEVSKENWLGPHKVKTGDALIGISSSGFHSNGFSLVRRLVKDDETELKKELLTPTKLYVNLIQRLLKNQRSNVHGIAHITGGGFHNIPRMNEGLGYEIQNLPTDEMRPEAMNTIIKRSGLKQDALYETWNMGIGLVIACQDPIRLMEEIQDANEQCMFLGKVTSKSGLKFV